jgi:hypothetical protein
MQLGFVFLQFPADLPMMPKGINHSPDSPPVHFTNGVHACRPCPDGPRKHRIRICHRKNHSHRSPANRFGTEVLVLGRFVPNPKLSSIHRQPRHHTSVRPVQPKRLGRAKRLLIKLHRLRAPAHRQPWRDRASHRCLISRTSCHVPSSFGPCRTGRSLDRFL